MEPLRIGLGQQNGPMSNTASVSCRVEQVEYERRQDMTREDLSS